MVCIRMGDLRANRRNIVVIGGSAGALEAMRRIIGALPPKLDAAIFLVQHMGARHETKLDILLRRNTSFSVKIAEDNAPICIGEIRTAVADFHLTLGAATMALSRGPKENHARPAIDALFRSAAAHHQSKVIAVLLSGYLSDGVSGLGAVRRCGGLTIVQSPEDAVVPDMPQNALDHHAPDYTGSAERIAELLEQLIDQPSPPSGPVPKDIAQEARMAIGEGLSISAEYRLGRPSPFACPDCNGNLWELDDTIQRYRCHVGHAYTADALSDAQATKLDEALWAALRGLRERSQLLRRLANKGQHKGQGATSSGFEQSASEIATQADILENFILQRTDRKH